MRTLFWNIRAVGRPARKRQIKEYIHGECLDCVGLQETKTQDFTDKELREISGSVEFSWKWLPSQGLSGGILMGVKVETVELEDVKFGSFSISMNLRHRLSNFRWCLVVVYGPANHDLSGDFVRELIDIYDLSVLPVIFGGDFNLIREAKDKKKQQC